MKKINMNYAIYFNKKYNYIGHLFQDRFFSELIENSSQILTTSRYIHLNPVMANMVKLPEDYMYSSYRAFIGLEECEFINKNKILCYFDKGYSSLRYQQFIESKIID